MPNFNSVVLLGRLTRDPELRYTPQGAPVCDFTVAVNRTFTKKDGEKVEEAAFVDVTAWNRLAEISAEYLKKGRTVLICGHLVQDRWEDETTGQKRSKIRIQASTVQFLGGSKDGETSESEVPTEEPAIVPDAPPAPNKAPVQKGRPATKR